MNAEQFLNQLQQRQLVDAKVLVRLRQQVAQSASPLSAAQVAKLLVDRGLLTLAQAGELLTGDQSAPGIRITATPTDLPSTAVHPGPLATSGADQELGIAPGFEDELKPKARREQPAPRAIFEIDEAQDAAEGHAAQGALPPAKQDRSTISKPSRWMAAPPVQQRDSLHETSLADLTKDELFTDQQWPDGPNPLAPIGTSRSRWRWLRAFSQRHGKTFQSKQWDSPLMLVGGGTLVLLLLVGLFLLLYLWRGSGQELFQQAEADYKNQAYKQSIAKYDRFLARYPRHPQASLARVRSGLARLRSLLEERPDLDRALAVANEVLPGIKEEPAFADARPELAGLLPDIYQGFVQQAKASPNIDQTQQYLQSASEARKLVDNSEYLPTSLRQPQQPRIEAVDADVELLRRQIDQDKELKSTVDQILQVTSAGNAAEAYQLRRELLDRYPRLANHELLHQAVLEIARKEQAIVRPLELTASATTQDDLPATPPSLVLADRTGAGAGAELANHVLFVLVRGAVYGLDAATGQPLWRRYVGFDTMSHPIGISADPGADALIVDEHRHELVRLAARSGKLIWRFPAEEPLTDPVLLPDRILVATESGRLLSIDPATGQPQRGVSLPQRLQVAPAIDVRQRRVYQIGQHSTLLVLDADSLQCTTVVYLGHEEGGIDQPPAVVSGHVVVAENAGLDYSFLHVLADDSRGDTLAARGEPMRLDGQVVAPLVVSGRRLFVVTDRGAAHALEVDPNDDKNPLREIAKIPGTAKDRVTVFPLVHDAQLFLAGMQLANYELHVARGELVQKWIKDNGDAFVAPLARHGDVLFGVRERRGAAGVSVSATRIGPQQASGNEGQRIWQTDLAVPLAHAIAQDEQGEHLAAISAQGALFDIDQQAVRGRVLDRPRERMESGPDPILYERAIAMDGGKHLLVPASSAGPLVRYDPSGPLPRLRPLQLPQGVEARSAELIMLGGALLVPSRSGRVYLVDLRDSEPPQQRVRPFQPRLTPGSTVEWRRPAAVDDAKHPFLIADQRGRLFLVGQNDKPLPHLTAQAESELGAEVVSPLATVGPTGYVVVRKSGRDVVVGMQWADLSAAKEWELEGRVVWGPERIADLVLVASDSEGLIGLEAGAAQRWISPLPFGPLAGSPLVVDDTVVLASVGGTLWRVSARTGQQIPWEKAEGGNQPRDQFEVNEPLAAGPVAWGRRLLLAGRDGTLYVTAMPPPAQPTVELGKAQ